MTDLKIYDIILKAQQTLFLARQLLCFLFIIFIFSFTRMKVGRYISQHNKSFETLKAKV